MSVCVTTVLINGNTLFDFDLYFYYNVDCCQLLVAARVKGSGGGSNCYKPNVFLVCRALPSEEPSTTCTVWNTHDPCFCYSEVII